MTKRLFPLLTTLLLPLLLAAMLISASRTQAAPPDICSTCKYTTIQAAVSNGPENTPMTIASETFSETVEITRSITLVGSGSTIIDSQAADAVILVTGGPTVSISGVTIQNGDSTNTDGGGGLLNESGTVTLTDTIVQNNLALDGGGISNKGTMVLDNVIVRNNAADDVLSPSFCQDCIGGGILNSGVLTLTNGTMIHGNTANFGGGIDNTFTGVLVATDVEIYDNSASNKVETSNSFGGGIENLNMMTLTGGAVHNNDASFGGGIYNEGTLTVSSSDLYGNVAAVRGGGIHNLFNLMVQTSNIYENEAGSDGGGGLSSESGTVLVAQTAVYNNSATGSGGGILHNVLAGSNSFTMTNSTISGNSTSGTGGGIRNAGIANTSLNNVTLRNNSSTVVAGQSLSVLAGSVTVKNSIISNQTGNNCNGAISSQGHNIANDASCSLNATADLPNTNPLLGPLQNNGGNTLTHALLLGSPAIDSGSGCPAVDQRGVARPYNGACDRGAYEYNQVTYLVYLPFVIRP